MREKEGTVGRKGLGGGDIEGGEAEIEGSICEKGLGKKKKMKEKRVKKPILPK